MAAVGVLPLVPATTIEPCGSSEASVAAISGAMRAATRPGRLVAPPRPDSTEARPACRTRTRGQRVPFVLTRLSPPPTPHVRDHSVATSRQLHDAPGGPVTPPA